MRMRFSIPAALGSIIGWFIISPLFKRLPYTELSLIDMLQRGIIGLLVAIFIGLFFGTIEDYFEAKAEHARLMKDYIKLKSEIKNKMEHNGRLNPKK